MKRPIKAKDAEKAISKFIDDDGIANGIISLKNKDPNADARPAIMRGFNRLKLYTKGEPSYLTTIKFNRKFEIQDKNIKNEEFILKSPYVLNSVFEYVKTNKNLGKNNNYKFN